MRERAGSRATPAGPAPCFWREGGQGHLAARALLLSHRRRSGRQPWWLLDTAVSGGYGERVPPRRQNGGVKPGSAGLAHTSDLGRERRAHQVVDLLRRGVLHLRGDVLRTRRRLRADPGATLSGSFCVRG